MSSASSSRRASNRSRNVPSGSAIRAIARPNRTAASSTPGPMGKTSHSSAPYGASPRRAPPMRANTWWRTRRSKASVGFGLPGSSGPPRSGCSFASRLDQPGAGSARAACKCRLQRRLQHRAAPRQAPRSAVSGRGRATGRPRRRAASGAVPRSPARTVRPRTPRPPRRTRGGPRRTRSGVGTVLSSSPPHAACVITRAWLATTSCAPRARRIVCSTKQRRQCGQAAWMHSPRRSARPRMVAAPNSSASQPGRSPPWMSPSAVTSAQREIRPSGMIDAGPSPGGGSAQRVLQVEQTEVILPALAHHDALVAFGRDPGTGGSVPHRSGAAGGG